SICHSGTVEIIGTIAATVEDVMHASNYQSDITDGLFRIKYVHFLPAIKSIESQLGVPVSQIFADISPEPVAAASLGQLVHYVNCDSLGLAKDFLSLGFIPDGVNIQSVSDALRNPLVMGPVHHTIFRYGHPMGNCKAWCSTGDVGLWGAVKKIEPGLRAYQNHRASEASLSRCAFMAQINTKITADYLRYLESTSGSSEGESSTSNEKQLGRNYTQAFGCWWASIEILCKDRN
ncbi:hypothetical protein IFM89_004409, partial [Coptis chinensis]